MDLIDVLIIGLALSMDAFAVCLSSAVVYPGISGLKKLSMPVAFGVFQGLMPLAGYFFGGLFGSVIEKIGGVIAFFILALIGVNMIRESMGDEADEEKQFTLYVLILQAISTSIDACAAGVSFVAMSMSALNAVYSSFIIMFTTFVMCIAALFLGNRLGDRLGKFGGILGGAVLIIIGIKSLF